VSRTFRKSRLGKKYQDKDKGKWEIHKRNKSCMKHNGGCQYCEANRLHNRRRLELYTKLEIEEYGRII